MSSTIHKIKQIHDLATDTWVDEYEAPGLNGKPVRAEVPRDQHTPDAVIRALLRKGAKLPSEPLLHAQVIAAIAEDALIFQRAASNGWAADEPVFITGSHVSSGGRATNVLPPTRNAQEEQSGDMQRRGDLEGWQALARIAQYSTAMIRIRPSRTALRVTGVGSTLLAYG